MEVTLRKAHNATMGTIQDKVTLAEASLEDLKLRYEAEAMKAIDDDLKTSYVEEEHKGIYLPHTYHNNTVRYPTTSTTHQTYLNNIYACQSFQNLVPIAPQSHASVSPSGPKRNGL